MNSTVGYLLVKLWNFQARDNRDTTEFGGEIGLMEYLMDYAVRVAQLVDQRVDFANYVGCFDYDYAPGLAAKMWQNLKRNGGPILSDDEVLKCFAFEAGIPLKEVSS
jgi:hypothetical protein